MSARERLERVSNHLSQCDGLMFTRPDSNLTLEERIFYERNGFLVVKGLLKEAECDKFLARFQEICAMNNDQLRKLNFLVMRDISMSSKKDFAGEDSITKLQDWQNDEQLFEFCKHPAILEYVRSFCGANVKSIHTMLINKPPDSGAGTSRHPMHQDLHYFPLRPADRIVCAWAALEKIHKGNGCLTVVPGSHRQYPLLPHVYPDWEGGVNKMYHGVNVEQKVIDSRVHLEMEKGDVVLFHPLLLHGSGTNRTAGFRKAISCHYASADCYPVKIAHTSQEWLAKEAVGAFAGKAERLFGKKMEDLSVESQCELYTQMWHLKSKQVCGRKGTF